MDETRVQLDAIFDECMKTRGLHRAAPRLAVAVSGGPDSLALAHVAHTWIKENHGGLVAFTVDHALRPDSRQEAEQVHQWLSKQDIEHHILTWNGPKPQTRIQESARQARYGLLTTACRQHKCTYLLLGHHQGDQHETFFMRLAAGSGPDGLAGMHPVSEREGIVLLRPFLKAPSQALRSSLETLGQAWLEDPTNINDEYQRTRLRRVLQEEEFSPERLDLVLSKFQDDRDYFENEVKAWCQMNVQGDAPLYVHLQDFKALSQLHPALGHRILQKLLQAINGRPYPLGSEQMNRLWKVLQSPNFKAMTCGGCYLIQRQKGLHIQRELAAITEEVKVADLPHLWDQRIYVENLDYGAGATLKVLGPDSTPDLKNKVTSEIPSVVWPTLPAIWKGRDLIAVPHLNYILKDK